MYSTIVVKTTPQYKAKTTPKKQSTSEVLGHFSQHNKHGGKIPLFLENEKRRRKKKKNTNFVEN